MCSKSTTDFKVLPLKFSKESTGHHYLYLKEHSVRNYDEKKPPGKTLFVMNVPPYADEESLKLVFLSAGKVKSVILQTSLSAEDEISGGFKIGYVVFEKREALLRALNLKILSPLSTDTRPIKTGLNKWINEYNNKIFNHQALADDIQEYMNKYDAEELANKQKGKEEVDDDGWTTVTKRSRTPGLALKESVETKVNKKLTERTKKKELKNFYTFQIRESKKIELAHLRKNFEDSKKKVEQMKQKRSFRPF